MRRLVADLLLLARTDAARPQPREPCDLAQVVIEAASELGAVSGKHEISLDVRPARMRGARDELHRLAINLIENAIRHTPPGTEIDVSTGTLPDGRVELVVADNGPGIPAELAPTLFERFVRGSGDRGGSFGLGLAIVQAVVGSHGGSVELDQGYVSERGEGGSRGARFVVRLPGLSDLDDDGQHHRPTLEAVVD
jgi:signal transduction histidine kinase